MKKILLTILALLIVSLTVVGCGGNAASTTTPPKSTTSPSITVTRPPVTVEDFFAKIAEDPAEYNGQAVTITGYYFSGFEKTVICESLTPNQSGTNYQPSGKQIWADWKVSSDITRQLFQQENSTTGYTDRIGRLQVTGVFQYGGRYGHLNSYTYQISIVGARIVAWNPEG